MTKKTRIEDLHRRGETIGEIHAITGFSRGYISNVLSDIRHPGSSAAASKRWINKNRSRVNKYRKSYKKDHPEEHRKMQRLMNTKHQEITLPSARQRGQEWTMREIEFLETRGKELTILQIALALGRTYNGVQMKAHGLKLDLHGDKMGTNANRFKSLYQQKEATDAAETDQ
ncbi:MAG: hypothetical protein Q7R91_00245 [bacterium]|nr:hypothetical protein [bacterium]